MLGRVKLATGGRLDFSYRSQEGHDANAHPPLEWLERSLRTLDFTKVRLTRRKNGLVGTIDEDLLEATRYNFVGLLYPQTQIRLEVEWRLQRERDVALLAKVHAGKIKLKLGLAGSSHASAKPENVTGASDRERVHLTAMCRDPDSYRALRDVLLSDAAEPPLERSITVAAIRRARNESADTAVEVMLRQWLYAEDPAMAADFFGSSPPGPRARPSNSISKRSRRDLRPLQPGNPSR